MTSFFRSVANTIGGGAAAIKGQAVGFKEIVVEESGLQHLGKERDVSNVTTLKKILEGLTEDSRVYKTWQDWFVDPLLRVITVTPVNGTTVKVCKRITLLFAAILVTAINLALTVFYVVEVIFQELKKIFTAPYHDPILSDPKRDEYKRFVVRFGSQIPHSISGAAGSVILGPLTAISATLLNLAKFGGSF